MIYALDKVAPGTANDDTLLYGVEVKFYNMEVEVDHNLMTCHDGLYVIGDGSGITHSLSHASASGVYVARQSRRQFNNKRSEMSIKNGIRCSPYRLPSYPSHFTSLAYQHLIQMHFP